MTNPMFGAVVAADFADFATGADAGIGKGWMRRLHTTLLPRGT
jgi:hypothetical protein